MNMLDNALVLWCRDNALVLWCSARQIQDLLMVFIPQPDKVLPQPRPNPDFGQRVHVATKTCPIKDCKSAIPNVAPKPILREKEALERSLASTLSKLKGQDPSTACVIIACTKKEQMLVESVKVMTFGLSSVRGGHLSCSAAVSPTQVPRPRHHQ